MHVALTLFTLGPGMREVAEKTGSEFGPVISSMKGFKSMTMFGDEDTGEYGGLSVWASKEDAEAALETTGPKMKEALGDKLKGSPSMRVFEVFEPEG